MYEKGDSWACREFVTSATAQKGDDSKGGKVDEADSKGGKKLEGEQPEAVQGVRGDSVGIYRRRAAFPSTPGLVDDEPRARG